MDGLSSASFNLPEDVLIEILLRLPVKSLLKFRCVCKSWYALIKSRRFVDMHLSYPRENYFMLNRFINKDLSKSFLSLHSYNHNESLSVVEHNLDLPAYPYLLMGSCNGIVCLKDFYDIYLFNPATHEFRTLPTSPFGRSPDFSCRRDAVGFGFDHCTNEYKVVAIVTFDPIEWDGSLLVTDRAEIYSLSSNSWREIDAIFLHIHHFPCCTLLFNGSFHWHAFSDQDAVILCFDMSIEVFREIQLPDVCVIQYPDGSLGEANGKLPSLVVLHDLLALVLYTDRRVQTSEQFIDVWVMVEYGVRESWTKRFSIGPFEGIEGMIINLNDDELLFQSIEGQLVSCSLQEDNHQLKKHDVHGIPTKIGAVMYKKSMVSLGGSITDR